MSITELRKQLKAELPLLEDHGEGKLAVWLGTSIALESIAPRAQLESAARSLNAWIENGEGDGCDIFLCMNGGKD